MDKDGPPQSLKRDAAYVYVAYALRFLSVMILVPYYGRILGPAEYGKVLAAMSLMALVWMIVNYGFSTSGARELASSGDKAVHSHIFSRQISARLALFPAGMIVGALATWFSPVLRANPWFGAVATALGLINAMNLGWFYQGLRRFKVSLVFEAVAYPLNVIFVLILVRNTSDGIEALLANLAAAGIASSCAHMVAFRLVRPAKLGIKEGWAEIKAASTIFLLGVNSVLMASGSTYMLSILSTPSQVGYFGSVEKLVSFSLAFLQPAAQVLMPTIAHRATHASAGSQQLVKTGIQLELAYGICAAVGGTVLASPLASGLYQLIVY
jgi:O-antigen/teichoic acid export membrane protein